MQDTIFALSSGAPPAAIAVIRISGPRAGVALEALARSIPPPRRASLRRLTDASGAVLDEALVLWLPGPANATGEDCAELHCHGGRAVVVAVERALAVLPGLRRAEPGEFTRRAFANGRIDLAQAEGLADLLAAETELQRLAAAEAAGGALSARVEAWRTRVLGLSAMVEAVLDFVDEDDVASMPATFAGDTAALQAELEEELAQPRAERLRDGVRVILAGPPNSGKSSLFNRLLDESAAIVSDEAGTTRDVLERAIAFGGVPFTLADTAGLRDDGAGAIERIGIARAEQAIEGADIVLWLGAEGEGPSGAWDIETKADLSSRRKREPRHRVSAVTGQGVSALVADLIASARALLPKPGALALNARQSMAVGEACAALDLARGVEDLILLGEHLRIARKAFDRLLGRDSTEAMLDSLFGRFCIGK